MKKFITGGFGIVASELIQQSNANEIAGVITQLLIAIVTLIEIFNKKKINKNETKNSD